jgi:hypothetical protein
LHRHPREGGDLHCKSEYKHLSLRACEGIFYYFVSTKRSLYENKVCGSLLVGAVLCRLFVGTPVPGCRLDAEARKDENPVHEA